jgi:hypothetical protein
LAEARQGIGYIEIGTLTSVDEKSPYHSLTAGSRFAGFYAMQYATSSKTRSCHLRPGQKAAFLCLNIPGRAAFLSPERCQELGKTLATCQNSTRQSPVIVNSKSASSDNDDGSRHFTINPVTVFKLFPAKFQKIELRQDAL